MKISTLAMVAAISLFTGPALAAEGIGEAVAVLDKASLSGKAGRRPLAIGSKVAVGDVVLTDAAGQAQLLFNDGTRMVVGSNASLVINEFLFRGKSAENRFVVNALGGAFRFISGDAGDQGTRIQSPMAAIGINGTAFDFSVAASGATRLLLLEGSATMCTDAGNCKTVDTPCSMLQTDDGITINEFEAGIERTKQIRQHFPYLTSQSKLLAPFQVEDQGCTKLGAAKEGGLSNFALDQSTIRTPVAIAAGAAAAAVAACLLAGSCGGGSSGGGGGSAINTNNGTNN
jgi:hypothetical protein